MSANPNPTRVPHPSLGLRGVFVEAVTAVLAGLLLGLLLNAISPRGLKLHRNYFPAPPGLASGTTTNQSAATSTTSTPTNAVFSRLLAQGLQPLHHLATVARFHESQRTPATVIFVDVRNDALYQAGHIPGAHQLDYYRPEAYLPDVLAACATAQQIIVYCTGGDCEDSELAAGLLIQSGVPRERVFVYPGGFTEWSAHDSPLATGPRVLGTQEGNGL